MSFDEWMDWNYVVYKYSEILVSYKKEKSCYVLYQE